ncbi:MAG: PAS-domain containing protein, partial [Rhodobacterales bacterium]|nr:PAS-domain containing protein [Rhodobacterales bacterium]MDX5412501.1 PAS-domain containing protein [Rhodobacterales bacterium]
VVERLEKGLDALSAAFVIYDKDDRLLHWNETYPALMGSGDMVRKGMPHEDILRDGLARGHFRVPEGQEEVWVQETLDRHRKSNDAVEVELSNGRWIRAMSIQTEDGDRVGVRFDVTDLKRAQIAAEQASAAKSEFIALVSHELRTPLTVILGFGKLLSARFRAADTAEQDDFAVNAVDRIVAAGEGLLVLVNNMLDYIHLKTGTLGKNPREFVLGEVMSNAIARVAAMAAEKSITLELEESADRITADPARVEQALDQLLSNAVKFTHPGGTVSLRSTLAPDQVRITVEDTGPGIPDDKLDVIFEEFSQLQPTGTRREGGTGLGLAIARRLARFQGGDVLVQSVPGQGSVFTFVLPR